MRAFTSVCSKTLCAFGEENKGIDVGSHDSWTVIIFGVEEVDVDFEEGDNGVT